MNFFDSTETIIEFVSLIVAIGIFIITSIAERKATDKQSYREAVRATLKDFTELRRYNQSFFGNIDNLDEEQKNKIVKKYIQDLERFAVGCNMGAYILEVINRMSGGSLVNQWHSYFKPYIEQVRRNIKPTSKIKPERLYCEFEEMMRELFKMRGLEFDPVNLLSEDEKTLELFLNMNISSADEIFEKFRTLPGAIEKHGEGKQGYIYIPGSRKDRCLLVAHADTVSDLEYIQQSYENSAVLKDGVYYGTNSECSFGADDRAGCAILWLLRDSGHSLLVLDGEEHGQIGANYLKDSNRQLYKELNEHTFMLQLDRRGCRDYKCYDIPVTDEFTGYIEGETDYIKVTDAGKTDIKVLCSEICGANLSIGYYNEHHPDEVLVVDEWKNTLETVRKMLNKPLQQFKTKTTA